MLSNTVLTIDQMPDEARIWIYQADRKLSQEEVEKAEGLLNAFVQQWDSHGVAVKGTYEIVKGQFVLISADERQASVSGCSIDKSVAVVRQLEEAFGVNFLDKSKVAYEKDGEVSLVVFNQVKQLVDDKEITPDSLVYNNTVTTVGDWKKGWKVAAKDSWVKRFF